MALSSSAGRQQFLFNESPRKEVTGMNVQGAARPDVYTGMAVGIATERVRGKWAVRVVAPSCSHRRVSLQAGACSSHAT
jgi:hypothetical protein